MFLSYTFPLVYYFNVIFSWSLLIIVPEVAQQRLSTVESFNAIPFWIAMTILVHSWASNTPVSVALLRYIEKNQYRVPKPQKFPHFGLLQMNKSYQKESFS